MRQMRRGITADKDDADLLSVTSEPRKRHDPALANSLFSAWRTIERLGFT